MNASPKDPESDYQILTFRIEEDEAATRLDTFLAARIQDWSRARLQRLIEDEEVLVNGKPAKASYKLHARDEIEIELTQATFISLTPEEIPLEIVYEDEEIIVINKPAGLVVHPAAGNHSGTLANALAYHFQQLATDGGDLRPGIVHRLDKGTSGLLVIAKTQAAHENLGQQFRSRTVFKSYAALVQGAVEHSSGSIDKPIARDPRNRTRMAVVPSGRKALTLYRVRRRYLRFTLLEVQLKTGRTHQVRVHLAWLKHPIVGDEIYGGGRDNTVQNSQLRQEIDKLQRHFLHAEQLGFLHPKTGQPVRFSAPLPAGLSHLLEVLEATRDTG